MSNIHHCIMTTRENIEKTQSYSIELMRNWNDYRLDRQGSLKFYDEE